MFLGKPKGAVSIFMTGNYNNRQHDSFHRLINVLKSYTYAWLDKGLFRLTNHNKIKPKTFS